MFFFIFLIFCFVLFSLIMSPWSLLYMWYGVYTIRYFVLDVDLLMRCLNVAFIIAQPLINHTNLLLLLVIAVRLTAWSLHSMITKSIAPGTYEFISFFFFFALHNIINGCNDNKNSTGRECDGREWQFYSHGRVLHANSVYIDATIKLYA